MAMLHCTSASSINIILVSLKESILPCIQFELNHLGIKFYFSKKSFCSFIFFLYCSTPSQRSTLLIFCSFFPVTRWIFLCASFLLAFSIQVCKMVQYLGVAIPSWRLDMLYWNCMITNNQVLHIISPSVLPLPFGSAFSPFNNSGSFHLISSARNNDKLASLKSQTLTLPWFLKDQNYHVV